MVGIPPSPGLRPPSPGGRGLSPYTSHHANRPSFNSFTPDKTRLQQTLLPRSQYFQNQLEMRRLHPTLARSAHQIIEYRRQFQNLKSTFPKITIATNVAIPESENMPELVCERSR